MKPFLQSVAECYFTRYRDVLGQCCFVFPQKRAGRLFLEHLAAMIPEGEMIMMPKVATIVDFVEGLVPGVTADRMEQIFILFQAYRNVVASCAGASAESLDFNRFIRWADTILADFDDADTSLADVDGLFHNVDALKEISANYLTAEQIDIIRDYWKEEDIPKEIKQFWNHISYPSEDGMISASAQFVKLWQVLADVYHEFNRLLAQRNLRTAGSAFRRAFEIVRATAAEDMPFARYVFVGFNSLSASEIKLFDAFRDKKTDFAGRQTPLGDFYWDLYLPLTESHPSGQQIGRTVRRYARSFPSEFDIFPDEESSLPRIDVIGLPSRVGQAKVIGAVLPQFFPDVAPDAEISPVALRKTAIILPEEPMLIPMLSSMSPRVRSVNITLGYKLNTTAVARLVSEIIGMQMRAYKSKSSGRVTFFYEDVIRVLSNPLMRLRMPRLCSEALLDIHAERLFNVPESFFHREKFSRFGNVFTLLAAEASSLEAFGYLDGLMSWITEEVIPAPSSNAEDVDEEEESSVGGERLDEAADYALQVAFVRRYRKALAYLHRLAQTYLSSKELAALDNASVFSLIEKIVRGETLNMEGTPYAGVQIMGMLEARALDFENVVIPSMNERIFPRAKTKPSFIPMVIRSAYGLPTNTERDDALAYQFYRLLSRCKRVVLTYDARTSGTRSGQLSRFALQLLSIFKPAGITHTILPYTVSPSETYTPVVYKTPEIMKRLRQYTEEENPRYLSASSIKQYINCPMSFYLERIKHYKREDEVTKWMDDATFGTIVHNVFEQLYNRQLTASPGGAVITARVLDDMMANRSELQRAITMAINEFFHKKGNDCTERLAGSSQIMGHIVEMYVLSTLKAEKAIAPFTFKASEHTNQGRYTLRGASGREMTINFHYRIDRIDSTAQGGFDRLRIVDYKTGVDETEASSIDDMMEESRLKAFLQLILYCDAYSQIEGYTGPIQPVIYRLQKILLNGITPLKGPLPFPDADKYGIQESPRATKFAIYDYRTYVPEVNDRIIDRLEELFNPEVPFQCTDNEEHCRFCAFTTVCGRHSDKE